jgi:pyrroline-5-carboxylate reductase
LKNGIDVNTGRDFVVQLLYGASKFLKNSNEKNVNHIKYAVTTPNGTTIAGLSQLDKYRFKHALNEAITSATERGKEIEKEKMNLFRSKF